MTQLIIRTLNSNIQGGSGESYLNAKVRENNHKSNQYGVLC